jgi:hypothetical protein
MGHHDLFFKKTFSIRENAADFRQHTLAPELIEEMNLDTLTIEKGSHVVFNQLPVFRCEPGQADTENFGVRLGYLKITTITQA